MVSYAILSDQAIIQNPDPHLMDKHLHKLDMFSSNAAAEGPKMILNTDQ